MDNKTFRKILFPAVLLGLLIVSSQGVFGQNSEPCRRLVAANNTSLGQLNGGFNSVFHRAGVAMHAEPLWVEWMTLGEGIQEVEDFLKTGNNMIEYLFRCKITPGNDRKSFSAVVELVDVPRNIVVKTASASWADNGAAEIRAGEQLANEFMPLNQLLYDYEKIPLTGEIFVPGDEVGSGDRTNITLKNLRFRQEVPKEWQYLAIKLDQGKIINAALIDGYYYLKIGPGGRVDLVYEAPEECKDQEEHMEVHNCCIFQESGIAEGKKDKIMEKDFDIVCYDGALVTELDITATKGGLTGHNVSRIPFKRLGRDKVKGIGTAPQILNLAGLAGAMQSTYDNTNLVEFEGTITGDNAAARTLHFTHKLVGMNMKGSVVARTDDGQVSFSHLMAVRFEPPTSEQFMFGVNSCGGWWMAQIDQIPDHVETFSYGCDCDGDCGAGSMSVQNMGPVSVIKLCLRDLGCATFTTSPVDHLTQPEPYNGQIEWRNGAEIPVNYSTPGASIVGRTRLELYRQ